MLKINKDPLEEFYPSVGFTSRIGARTILEATCDVTCIQGTDPDAQLLLSGPAIVLPPDAVSQRVVGGVVGCSYLLRYKATLSDGDILVGHIQIDVRLSD